MSRKLTFILPALGILVLLIGGCGIGPAARAEPAPQGQMQAPGSTQGEAAAAQVEAEGASNDNIVDANNFADADQGTAVESSEAAQVAGPVVGTPGPVNPEDVPGLEEREAMLDSVNAGPEIVQDGQVGEPAPPGTESELGTENSPDDVLDKVNPGGPLTPDGDRAPGEGAAPGTESVLGPDSAETAPNDSELTFWEQLVQTVGNWLRNLLD